MTAPRSISTGMSHLQSRMYAAMEEAQRARQKKCKAADALRARQLEYETANLRGRQKQITRARAALEAAQAAYEAARRDVQRLDDKAERSSRIKLEQRTCNPAGCAATRSDAWVRGRRRRDGISLASPPWMVSCAWALSVSGRFNRYAKSTLTCRQAACHTVLPPNGPGCLP